MEPITLKCPHCATEWKLFKATAPILCPHCEETVPAPEGFVPEAPTPESPPAPAPVPESGPVTDLNAPPPLPEPPPVRRPFREPLALDPGERDYADPDDADDLPPIRRRGTHPLMKVILILLLVFVLLPIALIVLLFALCALSLR